MGLEGAVSVFEEVKKEKIKKVAPRGPIVARLGALLWKGPKGDQERGPRKGPKEQSLRRINSQRSHHGFHGSTQCPKTPKVS
jgi:hypothetical protein